MRATLPYPQRVFMQQRRGLTPGASHHSCTTSSEEPPLSNFNSQWNIPLRRGWYNPHRRHSALGYRSPINYERRQLPQSA